MHLFIHLIVHNISNNTYSGYNKLMSITLAFIKHLEICVLDHIRIAKHHSDYLETLLCRYVTILKKNIKNQISTMNCLNLHTINLILVDNLIYSQPRAPS